MRSLNLLVIAIVWTISAPANAAPPKNTPELLKRGKTVYTTNCLACHGAKGDGKGPAGAALKPPPRKFSEKFKQGEKPEQVFKTITNGVKSNPLMAAFKHLPEKDRWALTYYVLSFKKKK